MTRRRHTSCGFQRRSRFDGLASMSAVRELHHCRLLRPLLGVSREDLRTMLRANGQSWIDDPSNADPRFERTQLRRLIAGGSFSASTMVADAKVYGQKRSIADRAADKFLACRPPPSRRVSLSRSEPIGQLRLGNGDTRRWPRDSNYRGTLASAELSVAWPGLGRIAKRIAHFQNAWWMSGDYRGRGGYDLPRKTEFTA